MHQEARGLATLARSLRRRPTDAERGLWMLLRAGRSGGLKFRRQHPLGPYVVDFVCLERRLVIEVDGAGHARRASQDTARDAWLATRGFRVLRFNNREVLMETRGVVERLLMALEEPPPRRRAL